VQITLTESFTAVPGIELPSDEVSNFLGGYVPEGHHRLVMASRRGIDAGDLFALLREFGGSLAGALTAQSPDIPEVAATPGWLEHLSDAGLGDLLR
jgi:serine/threonine-protein kinase HipA